MNATELYRAGKLDEAVRALNNEVRSNPADVQRRTFLFELLCFAGEYDRAEKQLDVLAQMSGDAQLGTMVYRAALQADRTRQEMFGKREYPSPTGGTELAGTLNGKRFSSLVDGDPRIGPRLEVIAGGAYMWISFEQIASIEMQAPRRLRDLLWIPAVVRTRNRSTEQELGEVLLPVLAPLSWKEPDDAVRLGRATVWHQDEAGNEVPAGQKILLVDGEECPFLELRSLEFASAEKVA